MLQSQEETEWQERYAGEAVWKNGKMYLEIKGEK